MRMPGASASTQSNRRGNRPNEPCRVSATMRDTPVFSAKTSNGSRILRFMDIGGRRGPVLRFGLGLRFVDLADHVKRALRIVLELVGEDALAAVQRVLKT